MSEALTDNADEWLIVAGKVISGYYDQEMTDSLRESLEIGLSAVNHPKCEQAIEHLAMRKKKR